ncbi:MULTISPECIES: BNR-4 repeat-containing protein [unclassified Saccharicrinis]|uniref:BNR-4 repeat-containing protein n=1 Tax=unclassified Saccharicrinis TaxID=2646859 RepID=UPI003D3435AE
MKEKLLQLIKSNVLIYLFPVFCINISNAQVTFVENTKVTDEALFFWKADDPEPYHYGAAINPHGNCVKVSNGYVFYTWYRGGFLDRTLMVSRKKIGAGSWVNVALPGKLSLVGGKGDTHLTTNIGICPIDGTVHIMYDHHNEDLNYIVSKKNIAFAADGEFMADNFLPQRDYLVSGKKVTGVTYPKMINNDQGELFFERRNGSAVGGDMMVSYYNGNTWTNEVKVLQGKGAEVTQGERNYCYGKPYLFNGNFYYVYSVRWAESPTRLNEGVYIANLGPRMDKTATTVDGKTYNLPIIDHAPFLIADPRSIPTTEGWAGGPDAAISPKNDIYLKISPKNTTHYNYLRKDGETEFTEERGKGSPGMFYGNRMFKCTSSNGVLTVQSCQAGSYEWRTDYILNTGIDVQKSQVQMENGKIVAVYAEKKASDKVPIHCYVFDIIKLEYTAQTITFDALPAVSESDADFTLSATASSGLTVTYSSSNPDVAQILEGNKVKIMGVGSCDIVASQMGNGEYDNAPDVSQTLTVNANTGKSNQTISFTLVNSTHVWGSAGEVLSGTATSGLDVEYSSSNEDVAVIVDGKLQVKRAGITIIKARQPGDVTYNAAPIISQTLTVPKQTQVITFEAISPKTSGDPEFNLVATSNNPNANLRFVCPNNQVAIVWDDIVRHVLGTGSATITVSDTGDDYFTSATVQKTLVVNSKTFNVPAKIEAEYYTRKSGVNVTRWSNTVFYLNAWGVNDYAEFTIDVPEDGTYPIDIHAAAPGGTKSVKVTSGSTTLATTNLTTTPSLTNFKTTTENVSLMAGVQKIRIVGVVGGFNLDWIQIKAKSGDATDPGNDVPDYVSQKDYTISSVDGEQDPNLAVNLFDGNITDDARWSAQEFPKSVVIDLGVEKEIIGSRLWTYQSRAYQFKIEVSNSSSGDFTQVVDRTSNTHTSQPISDDFSTQKGRYVKLTVTECHNYASNWVSINELVLIFDESTPVSKTKSSEINAYVANNQLFVESNFAYGNEVSLYTITGELILSEQFDSTHYTKTLNIQTGIYVVKVTSNNVTMTKKLSVR